MAEIVIPIVGVTDQQRREILSSNRAREEGALVGSFGHQLTHNVLDQMPHHIDPADILWRALHALGTQYSLWTLKHTDGGDVLVPAVALDRRQELNLTTRARLLGSTYHLATIAATRALQVGLPNARFALPPTEGWRGAIQ